MNRYTEKYLKDLIKEEINNNNEYKIEIANIVANGEKVYHRPKDGDKDNPMGVIDSLFKYGFSREYTGSNGGNMYGEGVYNVYTLRSSNEKATGYGRYIVQSYVINGFKDFLIFNRDIAKKYYGNDYHIENQIRMLMPNKMAEFILNSMNGRLFMNDFSSLDRKTSIPAVEITRLLGQNIYKTKIRGVIYDGGHDGSCAFVRDFSDVCPYAFSTDGGRTWKRKVNPELVNRLVNSIDSEFELKRREDNGGNKIVKDVSKNTVNGHNIVSKIIDGKTKFNLYSARTKSIISPVWFDAVTDFDHDMTSNILLNGNEYTMYYDNDVKEYGVCDKYGEYICDLKDIRNL